jgi:hypothetical protein
LFVGAAMISFCFERTNATQGKRPAGRRLSLKRAHPPPLSLSPCTRRHSARRMGAARPMCAYVGRHPMSTEGTPMVMTDARRQGLRPYCRFLGGGGFGAGGFFPGVVAAVFVLVRDLFRVSGGGFPESRGAQPGRAIVFVTNSRSGAEEREGKRSRAEKRRKRNAKRNEQTEKTRTPNEKGDTHAPCRRWPQTPARQTACSGR